MAELRTQLDQLLDEAVRRHVAADPEQAWRRGRRRRAGVAGGGVLVTVAMVAGLAWFPSAIDGRQPGVAASDGQDATVTMAPPAVRPGELAVQIQQPPAGLPSRYRHRITCHPDDAMPGFVSVVDEDGDNDSNSRPDTGVRPYRSERPELIVGGPMAFVSVEEGDPFRNTYLVVAVPEARWRLEQPDGSRGSITGPWKLISVDARTGAASGVRTDRAPHSEQAAVAWWCPPSRGGG